MYGEKVSWRPSKEYMRLYRQRNKKTIVKRNTAMRRIYRQRIKAGLPNTPFCLDCQLVMRDRQFARAHAELTGHKMA